MNYVYILQSHKNARYYIGSTGNLPRRITEHNSGKTKSLRNLLPFKVVFKKEYSTLNEARLVERKLKKAKSRDILSAIIADGDIKMGL